MDRYQLWQDLITLSAYAFTPDDLWLQNMQGRRVLSNVDDLLTEARRHRVQGTALSALHLLQREGHLDMDVTERAETFRAHYGARNARMEQEGAAICQALRSRGARFWVQRGPVISRLYKAPHWRYYKDFDIYFDKADWDVLDGALRDAGYIQGNYDAATRRVVPLSAADHARQFREKRFHAHLRATEGDETYFVIELHHQVFHSYEPYQLAARDLAALAPAQEDPRTDLPCFTPEGIFAEACMHIYSHATFLPSVRRRADILLYRWLDLMVLLRRSAQPLDWSRLLQLAQEHQLQLPLWYALTYLQVFYGADVPILDALRPLDGERQLKAVHYFNQDGQYGPVFSLERTPVERAAADGAYPEILAWQQGALLDEKQVRTPHLIGQGI